MRHSLLPITGLLRTIVHLLTASRIVERVLSYNEVRENLKSLMDEVLAQRIAVAIARKGSEPVIMMAKSEYDALMETFHLLRSPRNSEQLHDSIAAIEAGDVVIATLADGIVEAKH